MTLFRTEAIAYKNRDRLAGEVLITMPQAYLWIVLFFTSVLCLTLLWAFNAEYPRIESIRGVVLPDRGLVAVTPTRAGVLTEIVTGEGTIVKPGDLLALINVGESTRDGQSAADLIKDASTFQKQSLIGQISATRNFGRERVKQLNAQASGKATEKHQIKEQLKLLNELIVSASGDVENARAVAKNGFASKQYVQTSLDTLTQRKLSAVTLQQSLSAKEAELESLLNTAKQVQSETEAQIAGLNAALAQLDQHSVEIGLAGSYQIRATIPGTIAHVTFKTGQQVGTQQSLLTIVPSGSRLRAEFSVPSSAIGFIRKGNKVKVAFDAFPYQKFGTMEGVVTEVARSAISVTGERGQINLVYPVIVQLNSQEFLIGSNSVPLRPGMTLGARVVTERRTFAEWLFEPYYSVMRRD